MRTWIACSMRVLALATMLPQRVESKSAARSGAYAPIWASLWSSFFSCTLNKRASLTFMQRIVVKRGGVYASDRRWDAENFENEGDAVNFAKSVYKSEFLDLPPSRMEDLPRNETPRARKVPPRHACLGDFLP